MLTWFHIRKEIEENIKYVFLRIEHMRPLDVVKNNNEIVLLDTALDTDNIGDDIIMHYITKNISSKISDYNIYRVASHKRPNVEDIYHMLGAKAVIFCGTNILAPHLGVSSTWRFDKRCVHLNNAMTIGVGWDKYGKAGRYSKFVYNHIFDNNFINSVRDSQCERHLRECGVKNVINTGCLTCWGLDEKSKDIPTRKSKNVIFSLTSTIKDTPKVKKILSILKEHYAHLYYWPQGKDDKRYLQSIDDLSKVSIIDRNFKAYTAFLQENDYDYIGTRLHGGGTCVAKFP